MKRQPIIWGIILLFLLSSITPIASMNLNDGWIYDEETGTLSIEFSGEIKESYILKYILIEVSQVGIIYSHEYSFPDNSIGYIETSFNHGDSWNTFKEYNENSTNIKDLFVSLTTISLWIRFTVECEFGSGFWRIWDIDFIGNTRGTPPKSGATISSNLPTTPWYSSGVLITITARGIPSIKEIHYLLDGQEIVIKKSEIFIGIHEDGVHHLNYWAVDIGGNEEIPNTIPSIPIDSRSPNVRIISPEKGIYVLGKKLPITINNTIIIGGFNVEAEVYDELSGVSQVQFIIDLNVNYDIFGIAVGEPYKRYCDVKNNGKTKLRVLAEDIAGNQNEDTLDIYYYNFF